MLKKIGDRGSRQGEIKFLASKIYLLANTHTLTQNLILRITPHLYVHTHAQGYSRSLRSQTKIHNLHNIIRSKFTLHISVHIHTHGDYSLSLRSQIKVLNTNTYLIFQRRQHEALLEQQRLHRLVRHGTNEVHPAPFAQAAAKPLSRVPPAASDVDREHHNPAGTGLQTRPTKRARTGSVAWTVESRYPSRRLILSRLATGVRMQCGTMTCCIGGLPCFVA
jgi:hypothetical protein